MAELDSDIWMARKTGNVVMGARKIIHLLKSGGERPKLVVVASNAPNHLKDQISYLAEFSEVPLLLYKSGSSELGKALHKPFFVSAAAVLDEGESSILSRISRAGGKAK